MSLLRGTLSLSVCSWQWRADGLGSTTCRSAGRHAEAWEGFLKEVTSWPES